MSDDWQLSRPAKKEKSLAWMVLKPFLMLCMPFVIMLVMMSFVTGKSFFDLSFLDKGMNTARAWMNSFNQSMATGKFEAPLKSHEKKVNKWQDENGVWHFSDKAPVAIVEGGHIEQIIVSSNVNTVQMPKPEAEEEEEEGASKGFRGVIGDSSKKAGEAGELADNPMELLDQAKAIAEQMQKRNATLEDM